MRSRRTRTATRNPARPALGQTETQLSKAIRDAVSVLPWVACERYNAGVARVGGRTVRMASRGHSDIGLDVTMRIGSAQLESLGWEAVPARSVYLEVKLPGECVTVPSRCLNMADPDELKRFAQYLWLDERRRCGSYCAVVHSVEAARFHVEQARAGLASPGPEQWESRGDEVH